MHRLTQLIIALLFTLNIYALQSPHGKDFKLKCNDCHTTERWSDVKPGNFNHNKTNFPLIGQHQLVSCRKCHSTLAFSEAPTECSECHTDVHQQTVGTDCGRCHTSESWLVKRSKLKDIHQQSGFPLVGAHADADCQRCHVSGSRQRYDVINTECYSCHRDKYEATTTPNHRTSGLGTDCNRCHNMVGRTWNSSGQGFNHATFPLKGGHLGLTCIQCHSQGYVGTPTACVSCHLKDFNATTNPSHSLAKFSSDCQTCHTDAAWTSSSYNHNTATSYSLTGAHITVACNLCHTQGFAGISTTCVSCHLKDYNATTNPAHATAQFPTNCESCHTTTVWTTTTYNHDSQYFPINSGTHRGQWTTCSQCHTNPANYAVFSCLTCHAHDKTSMDSAHRGRSGYVYNSTNCLSCHPR